MFKWTVFNDSSNHIKAISHEIYRGRHAHAIYLAGRANTDEPPSSLKEAMGDDTSIVFLVWKCNAYDGNSCHFAPPAQDEQPIEILYDDPKNYSKCNQETFQCEHCDPGSGIAGCVPDEDCKANCSNTFRCDWSHSPPRCVADPKGSMTHKACTD